MFFNLVNAFLKTEEKFLTHTGHKFYKYKYLKIINYWKKQRLSLSFFTLALCMCGELPRRCRQCATDFGLSLGKNQGCRSIIWCALLFNREHHDTIRSCMGLRRVFYNMAELRLQKSRKESYTIFVVSVYVLH